VPTRDWGAAPEELTAEEVELLARAEHERFVAERLAAGWRWTSGPKDTAAKLNPTLVPWEMLDPREKQVDRALVREIPRALADLGFALRRREATAG
ncbi:MAG TPA: RyR domain-containing protein, partial [Thermoanaerobaculia bacterium]|nr:RyR domain-containing protein [Thermoanaerobaculia bacterium]